ncbi:hypothetical protein PR202_ga12607 [Eleusine coracana subsp. coracana]|uniref:Acyl carrier protein n=1 Tax=Eleusine coracana subsp. coracana TaxID=191504 RepID=A0AAV5CCL7_ELECO|nr:hypothetical protein PR202_ga12607 [Eleusine coracana subsp. coracana]
MQAVRTLVLQHLRLRAPPTATAASRGGGGRDVMAQCGFARGMSAPAGQEGGDAGDSYSESAVRARVVDLVKKFDKIDADKVVSSLCSAPVFPVLRFFFSSVEILFFDLRNLYEWDGIMEIMNAVERMRKVCLGKSRVTETADFQKDLSLDSLDRVELVMAFEQEFSIEIPDDKADKLSCCADVAKYIMSESQSDASSS